MTEFCLWDDDLPDDMTIGALAEERAAEKRKQRHAKATDKRGGLKAIAEKASLTIFGMSLRDVDREAAKTLPRHEQLEAAYQAVRTVAGYDPDHASLDNGRGFARSDVVLGHALASAPSSAALASPGLALMVWRLAMRYRRQVPARLNFVTGFTDQDSLFDD